MRGGRQRQSDGGLQSVSDSEELLRSRWASPRPVPGEIQQTDAQKDQVRWWPSSMLACA